MVVPTPNLEKLSHSKITRLKQKQFKQFKQKQSKTTCKVQPVCFSFTISIDNITYFTDVVERDMLIQYCICLPTPKFSDSIEGRLRPQILLSNRQGAEEILWSDWLRSRCEHHTIFHLIPEQSESQLASWQAAWMKAALMLPSAVTA